MMQQLNEKAHALLSPSASHRWLNCTPSLRLEKIFGADEGSEAALEGTIAHALCALMLGYLKDGVMPDTIEADIMTTLSKSEEFTKDQLDKYYCPDMWDLCLGYAEFVMDHFRIEKQSTSDAVLMIETKIDCHMYGEGMFGTTDAAIVSDEKLLIFDFKYGKGVKVDANRNSQMMIYALGNIAEYEPLYAFEDVQMTIYQPRMENITEYKSTVTELKEWGDKVLRPKALDATAGKGTYYAGDWCRFCKARVRCNAVKDTYYNIYNKYKGKDLPTMTDDELAQVALTAKEVKQWFDKVAEYILAQMKSGREYKGLKLVAGRSNRVYSNPAKVAETLLESGYSEDEIYKERELKGLTEMQKLLKKKIMDELIGDLIIKPEGAPTMAPEDDKREAIKTAQQEFENIEI